MSEFRPRRRLFLSSSVAAIALLPCAKLGYSKQLPAWTKIARSVVDTIIPEDEFPGALNVGIDTRLFQLMSDRPKMNDRTLRLIDAINHFALKTHRRDFHKLEIEPRENLLIELLSATAPPQITTDLRQFRALIVTWYYQSPEGQESLGYLLPANYSSYG